MLGVVINQVLNLFNEQCHFGGVWYRGSLGGSFTVCGVFNN